MKKIIQHLVAEALLAIQQYAANFDERVHALEKDKAGTSEPQKTRARKALANPYLGQATAKSVISAARRAFLNILRDDKKVAAEGAAAMMRIILAEREYSEIRAWYDRKAETRENHGTNDSSIPPEAIKLYNELSRRGVTKTMFDHFTVAEHDFIASHLIEKANDYRHRQDGGQFMSHWRHGALDVPVAALTEDEKVAVSIAAHPDAEEQFMAIRFFNETAGRDLGLSPALALALLRQRSDTKNRPKAFTRLAEQIELDSVDRDLATLMLAFGFADGQLSAAWSMRSHLIQPQLRALERRHAELARARKVDTTSLMETAQDKHTRSECGDHKSEYQDQVEGEMPAAFDSRAAEAPAVPLSAPLSRPPGDEADSGAQPGEPSFRPRTRTDLQRILRSRQ